MRGTPNRLQNTPKMADSSQILMSPTKDNSSPPATAYPDTAQMSGLLSAILLIPIGASPSSDILLPLSVETFKELSSW